MSISITISLFIFGFHPLKTGIVNFYVNFTNTNARVDNQGGGIHSPGSSWYYKYNVFMVWAASTHFSSKCIQMDPQQLPKMIKLYSICNKCVMQKSMEGWIPPYW